MTPERIYINLINSSVEVLEVIQHETFPRVYTAGEWSFDIDEESNPEQILEAIGAWIAWYNFVRDQK